MCNPILDDFWNDSQRSCNACGGYWPFTQPGNCHDKSGKDLTMCGDNSDGDTSEDGGE